jgi:hypothetical protein
MRCLKKNPKPTVGEMRKAAYTIELKLDSKKKKQFSTRSSSSKAKHNVVFIMLIPRGQDPSSVDDRPRQNSLDVCTYIH